MNTLKAFLAKYSITSHSIAVAFAFLVAAYYGEPKFHDYVWQLYSHVPASLKGLGTVLIALYGFYRNWQKPPIP